MNNPRRMSAFIRKQLFRVELLWHSCPRYLLYYFYGYGKFHITPTRYKRYCIDVIRHVNQRKTRHSLLDIGCGIGDILIKAKYQHRVGLDHNQQVLNALKFRLWHFPLAGKVHTMLFRFGIDPIESRYDVIVICNWIHNIEPEDLRLQFEKLVNNNLNQGGELIFDTVKSEHYPFCHDEVFLAGNLHVTTRVIGKYCDSQLKGDGVRRIISFCKASN